MDEKKIDYQHKIVTIPNLLSLFRLLLIPLCIWLYCVKKDYTLTTLVVLLSGVTDVADGFLARKLHMVSELGKALDPVADKLTQIAVLFCLVTRFSYLLIPLILLVVKELFAAVTGLAVIRKTGTVMGAVWHGKAATVSLYIMMLIHLIWFNIPDAASSFLIGFCVAAMLLSFILYGVRNLKLLKQ